MLRENVAEMASWTDKTMTMLKEQQLEVCQRRIASAPVHGLFSGCALSDVQRLWDNSYYAMEEGNMRVLQEVKPLETLVLSRLPDELELVSMKEYELLERLIMLDGQAELMDWDEVGAALSLCARLWCTMSVVGEHFHIYLPQILQSKMLIAMSAPGHAEKREGLFRYDATMHGLLYLTGFLHAQEPVAHFLTEIAGNNNEFSRRMAYRYLMATFDYVPDIHGEMILIHPGLADPWPLMRQMMDAGLESLELDENMMLGGMNGILPEEIACHKNMMSALSGALRPEYDEEEAAEDLRMLAKQGVSLSEMHDVLASLLSVHPTSTMDAALMALHDCTPRWLGFSALVKN